MDFKQTLLQSVADKVADTIIAGVVIVLTLIYHALLNQGWYFVILFAFGVLLIALGVSMVIRRRFGKRKLDTDKSQKITGEKSQPSVPIINRKRLHHSSLQPPIPGDFYVELLACWWEEPDVKLRTENIWLNIAVRLADGSREFVVNRILFDISGAMPSMTSGFQPTALGASKSTICVVTCYLSRILSTHDNEAYMRLEIDGVWWVSEPFTIGQATNFS